MKARRIGRIVKTVLFILIFALLFAGFNSFMQPVWTYLNNYNTIHGFYEEPRDTVETLFLGSSFMINGVTPTELYDDYGICAYNLATEQQPLLASYYWLCEAYEYQSGTLKNVVLDVSMLRRDPPLSAYRKAFDDMRFSKLKYRAVREYTSDIHEAIMTLFPAFSYHTRWSSLERADFEKRDYTPDLALRGYDFTTERYADVVPLGGLAVPEYVPDKKAEPAEFDEKALDYFDKLAYFCERHDLRLVLIKTPIIGSWPSSYHNAAAELADEYGLELYDFNFSPYIDDMGYNHAADSQDNAHMNYYGAHKLTAWLGEYLVDECAASDVRGDERYAFLEDESRGYAAEIRRALKLENIIDPCDYISEFKKRGYSVIVAVRDEASVHLDSAQRSRLSKMGLSKLSKLRYGDCYICVIRNGKVVFEEIKAQSDLSPADTSSGSAEPLTYEGAFSDGTLLYVESGGASFGDTVSILIDGEEYAPDGRGLNIAVYDNAEKEVAYTALFDTFASPVRESGDLETHLREALKDGTPVSELSENLYKLYQYNSRCDNARRAAGVD
ncbi:MAG: hypothetical protein IKD89_04770 [Clostridia bacterium]|nr:hypothetical protein [Clostridia bacterium]